MSQDMIPMYKPLLEEDEIRAATEALELGWLGMGSFVAEFEKRLSEFLELGADRHLATVSTGHAALHLGLILAGVGPGDEVITPSFNNVADFQAIKATGAEPVFCDILPDTLCIDPKRAKELIGERTKAVIVMDYGSNLVDYAAIESLAETHDVRIIHDAAHSFGSSWMGRKIGSCSDICMLSFDPVKNITCIDGGALIVRTEEELQAIHEMRLIGMGQSPSVMYKNQRAWTYEVRRIGFRYHMANLHAAIGLAQLNKMDQISQTRREAAESLRNAFSDIEEIEYSRTQFHDITPFLFYVLVPADVRERFRAHLENCGVDTGIHWQPGHHFTFFKQCRTGPLPITEDIARRIVSLPLHAKMAEEDINRIIVAVRTFFRRDSR